MHRIKLRWLLLLAIGAVVILLTGWLIRNERRYPGFFGGIIYSTDSFTNDWLNRTRFESEGWKDTQRKSNEWPHTKLLPTRSRMVDDLLNRHRLTARTRDELEALLGARSGQNSFEGWDWHYYIGPGRYGNAVGDSEWLVFRFDSTGRVTEYKVVHD